jgi:predicted Zn-dependent protease
VILFDPHFMAQVADRICPDWGATSILAHEVGHHLAGHTLRQSNEPWRDELEADDFSGFVLARLGATLAEATSAAARISARAIDTDHIPAELIALQLSFMAGRMPKP